MIKGFRDNWLEIFFVDGKHSKKISAQIEKRLFRKLQMIDDAISERDLRSPPSNHFEKLSGRLSGKHSIRVNKQWRLIFAWDEDFGEAISIYLDNHSYN